MAAPALPHRWLFSGFLLIGLLSGFFIGNLSQASAATAEAHSVQQNSLIVLVDDLNGKYHNIQGIWLAARVEGSAEISWMPIYPALLDEAETLYSQPHSPLVLETLELDSFAYLAPLREQSAWWDEIFVLDETAIGMIHGLSGSAPLALADTWVEPQRALHEQVQIINSLCANPASLAAAGALDQFLALMPSHVQSSGSPFELITRWDGWAQAGFALSCTHPWAN